MKYIEVVFTDQGGPFINNTLDLTWTHALILLDGLYYEATWPRVKKSPQFKCVQSYTYGVGVPDRCYDDMLKYAESKLGTRYNFWGYFFPRWYGKTRGVYCSQFVCDVLRAGWIPLPKGAGWSPDKLLKALEAYL